MVSRRILVTGSSGRLGRALLPELRAQAEVREFDLAAGDDLRSDRDVTAAVEGCQQVVHLGALARPVPGATLCDYFEHNVVGTATLIRLAAAAQVERLVFASTVAAHGAEVGIAPPASLSEWTPYLSQRLGPGQVSAPEHEVAYATSKSAAEQVLAGYAYSRKVKVRVLRLGPVGLEHLGLTASEALFVKAVCEAVTTESLDWWSVRLVVEKTRG